ncbi:hypothetical protein BH10ACT1_BH10ACT1_43360 [soil metagenome]
MIRRRWWRGCVAAVVLCTSGVVPHRPAGAALDRTASASYAGTAVDRGFLAVYGRRPSAASKAYWHPRLVESPDAMAFSMFLMDTAEYRAGLGQLAGSAFVDAVYRHVRGSGATPNEQALWQAGFRNRSQNRVTMFAWAIENQFGPKLVRPVAAVDCSAFRGGGLPAKCERGGAGTQRQVSILQVRGTNIYVNRVWYQEVDAFVALARTKGWDLQAERDPGTPSWMLSPGSWRSWDEQQWLYDHGYPANPPGRSMHEWGLALDLTCNGVRIPDARACWDWVRANGAPYKVIQFRGAGSPSHPEAPHFSTTGA